MFQCVETSPVGSVKRNTVVFNLTVRVHGCNHIPTPTARVFCKWKLLSPISSSFASPSKRKKKHAFAGKTHVQEVSSSHQVTWDHLVTLPECIMRLEPKTKMLKSCILRLSIRQVNRQSHVGYTRLGIVTIDIAEYAGSNEILKTFLLEESHFNSTINVSIKAEQISGDILFRQKPSTGATMNTSISCSGSNMSPSNVTSSTTIPTSMNTNTTTNAASFVIL
jgi:hypothetical protein